MGTYEVALTAEAELLLESIVLRDRRIAEKLCDHMENLSKEPTLQGSPLRGELAGFFSRHCLGNRFRIVYKIDAGKKQVLIISVGIRKVGDKRDVYELTKKLARKLLIKASGTQPQLTPIPQRKSRT